jgi:CheY-like chemotaxis protein
LSINDETPVVVLVVEDEALLRMFTVDLLRDEADFKVVEAANADEALTVLEATGDYVRALVTDVEMPGSMDGFTFTRVVHKAWSHIGFVVVSGRQRPAPGTVPKGTMFLSKPFRAEALIAAVRSVLGPQPNTSLEPGRPFIPAGIKIDQPHTGIGSVGGLAQPVPEPEE